MKDWTPDQIRALRLRLDWTQARMATALGYSRTSSVSDLEKGKQDPSGAVKVVLQILDDHGGLPPKPEPEC